MVEHHPHDPNVNPEYAIESEPPSQLHVAVAMHHEPVAVDVRSVVFWGFVLVVLIAGSCVLMYGLVWWFAGSDFADFPAPSPVSRARDLPRAPRIEPNQALAAEQQRERMDEMLSRYAWINKEAGIARIPIERAMDLYAERALSAAGSNNPPREAAASEQEDRP